MKIEQITLRNYRNFENETVTLNPEVNVFRGENAQGKTNFLEALYLFSNAASYRAATEKELIRFGCDFFRLSMDFSVNDASCHGEYRVDSEGKREVSFNGIPVKKTSLLSEHFKTVLFCPEELEIIKGEKELRRNLLDDSICLLKPNYAKILRDYNKCIRQKNTLLKKSSFGSDFTMLDVWNQRLSEYAARLVMNRGSFTRLLEKYSMPYMDELTEGKERLSLCYLPSLTVKNTDDIEYVKNCFLEKAERLKMAEIERGQSLVGPHRDDLEFDINGKNAKFFGSQGQQRSVILCLKLALTEIIKDRTGVYPVVLLDDIMSELDKSRQSFLTEKIKGKQTVITCTGINRLRKSKRVTFFSVKNGTIKKEE